MKKAEERGIKKNRREGRRGKMREDERRREKENDVNAYTRVRVPSTAVEVKHLVYSAVDWEPYMLTEIYSKEWRRRTDTTVEEGRRKTNGEEEEGIWLQRE